MKNIVFIGAGNLAHHLSKAINKAGYNITQVYSRTIESAVNMADYVNAQPIDNMKIIDDDADLYIISVTDNAIEEILQKLDIVDKNIVHTAGSIDISVLNKAKNYGVFYPLQTFSKHVELDFRKIPVCIEANNNDFKNSISNLAYQVSDNVWYINSIERKQLHLSAVFACNFVNHLFTISKKILDEKNINFNILHPLIQETVNKALIANPESVQTGPALRNDTNIIEKHLKLLSSQPDTKQIYELITNSIKEFHKY